MKGPLAFAFASPAETPARDVQARERAAALACPDVYAPRMQRRLIAAFLFVTLTRCSPGRASPPVPGPRVNRATAPAQALRTCVDRWNQANMVGWGPAPVNVAFRRPVVKEHSSIMLHAARQLIVA